MRARTVMTALMACLRCRERRGRGRIRIGCRCHQRRLRHLHEARLRRTGTLPPCANPCCRSGHTSSPTTGGRATIGGFGSWLLLLSLFHRREQVGLLSEGHAYGGKRIGQRSSCQVFLRKFLRRSGSGLLPEKNSNSSFGNQITGLPTLVMALV